jgi:hypothetical protein
LKSISESGYHLRSKNCIQEQSLTLNIFEKIFQTDRSGKYTCKISNNYGTLTKTVALKVGEN